MTKQYEYGTVSFFLDNKGWGRIKRDNGEKDAYFHRSRIVDRPHPILGRRILTKKTRVRFVANETSSGPEALDVEMVKELGRVKFFRDNDGWGMIERDNEEADAFVHRSHILNDPKNYGRKRLIEGKRVRFKVLSDKKGPQAVEIETVPNWF